MSVCALRMHAHHKQTNATAWMHSQAAWAKTKQIAHHLLLKSVFFSRFLWKFSISIRFSVWIFVCMCVAVGNMHPIQLIFILCVCFFSAFSRESNGIVEIIWASKCTRQPQWSLFLSVHQSIHSSVRSSVCLFVSRAHAFDWVYFFYFVGLVPTFIYKKKTVVWFLLNFVVAHHLFPCRFSYYEKQKPKKPFQQKNVSDHFGIEVQRMSVSRTLNVHTCAAVSVLVSFYIEIHQNEMAACMSCIGTNVSLWSRWLMATNRNVFRENYVCQLQMHLTQWKHKMYAHKYTFNSFK